MGRAMKAGKKPKQNKMGGGSQQQQMRELKAMQKKFDEAQAKIDEMEVSTSSGGGAVTVVVSGKKEIKSIEIAKDIVDPDDVEMLQDLIMTAVNEAMRQMDEISQNEMNQVTGGLGLPEGIF